MRTILNSKIFIIVILSSCGFFLYKDSLYFPLLGLDDHFYLFQRQYLRDGLTFYGLYDIFTNTRQSGFWIPLAWLSYAFDNTLFWGDHIFNHHLSNIILHILNSFLVFQLFKLLSKNILISLTCSVIFLIHPLNVESVVWIASRKGLLSAFFGLNMIIIYIRCKGIPKKKYLGLLFYCLFVFSLMSKPDMVILPLLLMIIDHWPLKKINSKNYLNKIYEKIVLIFISAFFGSLTFLLHLKNKTIIDEGIPLIFRLMNSFHKIIWYIIHFIIPRNLAVFYYHQAENLSLQLCIFSFVALLLLFTICFRKRKKHPFIITGLIWFLISLFPVIGIVQAGLQSHADRFAYFPMIGLIIIVLKIIESFFSKNHKNAKILIGFMMILIFMFFMGKTRKQIALWKEPEILWKHSYDVTERNPTVMKFLGSFYLNRNNEKGALLLEQAHKLAPFDSQISFLLGNYYFDQEKFKKSLEYFQKGLQFNRNESNAYYRSGMIYLYLNQYEQAIDYFLKALFKGYKPSYCLTSIGVVKRIQKKNHEAKKILQMALERDKNCIEAKRNLAELNDKQNSNIQSQVR